jgi:hypothetical protein
MIVIPGFAFIGLFFFFGVPFFLIYDLRQRAKEKKREQAHNKKITGRRNELKKWIEDAPTRIQAEKTPRACVR